MTRRGILALWLAVIVLIHLIGGIPAGRSFWWELAGGMTPVVLVYAAVFALEREGGIFLVLRLDRRGIKREAFWLAAVMLAVFPAAFLVNHVYQRFAFGLSYAPDPAGRLGAYALAQIFLVAFPEELFFRGWLQTALARLMPPSRRVLGVPFGRSQIATAGLFAISHSLVAVQWWHGFIFFPALVFGWLKEKTGTVWAAAFFHAACNAFAYWTAAHYR